MTLPQSIPDGQGQEGLAPAFLEALAEHCWLQRDGCKLVAEHRDGPVAESWRHKALDYHSIGFAARHALEGCPDSLAELNDYFDTDHLCLWADVERIARRAV